MWMDIHELSSAHNVQCYGHTNSLDVLTKNLFRYHPLLMAMYKLYTTYMSFLPDGFADHTEPLYEDKGFHVELRNDRPTAITCDLEIALHVQWVISMAAIDLFVSCTVGSVTYKRGVSKGTPTQQQKLAERRALKLRSRPHRHHPPQAQSLHRSCEARIKTVGKNIEEIRACIAYSDNVTTIASFQASQQESLALSPRSETVLNSSATTHTDPYSEGLAIPRAPDDIGTPSIDLFTSEFPDIAALLDGGADPETGLYLDSPIFPDATQEDHVDSHLPENNEACTEANPDT
uniref:Uncharacterized protein n=1 Tax=Oryza nivara TaxID=4536 RepID=A0A0E0HZK9_ORYNI